MDIIRRCFFQTITIILFHILLHKLSHSQQHNFLNFIVLPTIVTEQVFSNKKREVIVVSCFKMKLSAPYLGGSCTSTILGI